MFQNRSDSALEDLILHDVVPAAFEIKGYNIRSDAKGNREAEMEKEAMDDGTKVTWHLDVIEKDERIEVIYELVGDADVEYKVSEAQEFHGASFGDEVDEDLPPLPSEEEPAEDAETDDGDGEEADAADDSESDDDADSDDGEEADSDDSEEDADSDEDGEDADSDDGDADSEDDMDAALQQITGDDDSDEDESGDDDVEDEPAADADAEGRTCPICSSANPAGANVCGTCSFEFE
jgi:hypothetical protein